MSFKKNFCPSPWFHMRINNSGSYEYCRWKQTSDPTTRISFKDNIQNLAPLEYFQKTMAPIRTQILEGLPLPECADCVKMEQHNKISGRQRQLLKVGIREQYFESTLASSPLRADFDYSKNSNGYTLRTPSDWQIDLGNYCNGACIFCSADSSSRLAQEFLELNLIDKLPPNSWCDDTILLQKFIDDLVKSDNITYLHFIGGETIITPGFKKILQALVDTGLSKKITIGFTTNLMVWSESIANLLTEFDQVNLGMSIESLTPINEYVRWPSKLPQTKELLDRWVAFGKQHNWLIQLRITPTCLTIHDLTTIYDYAWQHELCVESCNFLHRPEFLRINVLPVEFLNKAGDKLANWIKNHQSDLSPKIINIRNSTVYQDQLIQDAESYLNYINTTKDESFRLPELIDYLKLLESNRKNNILNYLPEYEELFRSAGY